MALRLGDEAPNFTAETTEGKVDLYDYLGDSWGLLFSHPADFTPVCTTELGELAKRKGEFDSRNTKLIGLERRPARLPQEVGAGHRVTSRAPHSTTRDRDPDRKVAELYDMIHPGMNEKVTVRSVFIIGPDKKVKLIITYPQTTGRNIDELLRVLTPLQLTAGHPVSTPVDWKQG
jgi:alkyl hydroperoxide reductase subunit AhpC